jgi:hypothetical protein
MLSQRTVAAFQRFLSALMYRDYLVDAVLDIPLYFNRLYAADIPRVLLDVIGHKTEFSPIPLTLFLFEGHAVALAQGRTVPDENERQIGAAYLLCFMAVALKRYEELGYGRKEMYQEAAGELVSDLAADGYHYRSGYIVESATGEVIRPVPLDLESPRQVAPAKPKLVVSVPKVEDVEPREDVQSDVPKNHIGVLGWVTILGLPAAIASAVATIFQVEIHKWFELHYPSLFR